MHLPLTGLILFVISQFQLNLVQSDSNCIGESKSLGCGGTNPQLSAAQSCIKSIIVSSTPTEPSVVQWGAGTVVSPQAADTCTSQVELAGQEKAGSSYTYNISKIGIILDDNDKYQLSIGSSFFTHNSCQFLLNIRQGITRGPRSSPSYCKYYNIQSPQIVSFADQCFYELEVEQSYDLNITNVHSGLLRIFRFFTPSQLFTDQALETNSSWQPLIGITIHDDLLKVYMQELPKGLEDHYVLQLVYTSSGGFNLQGTLNRWLEAADSSISFTNSDYLRYTINLLRCKRRPDNPRAEPNIGHHQCTIFQRHSIESSDILTSQPRVGGTGMMTSSTTNGEVDMRKTEGGILQNQDLYILLGTIFGVVFLAVIVIVVLFVFFKRRQGSGSFTARFSGGNAYSDELIFEEDLKSTPPTILLLYSYDCQQHLACVQSLALLLQNGLGCSVMADFWATQEIAERGISMWLQHKIATVNYVVVVCSTGARFKSVTNRLAQLNETTDDAYITAMRLLQSRNDTSGNQKLAVYFDYSCESDIPVLLENWQRYSLMQDVNLLISSIVDIYTKDGGTCNKSANEHEQIYMTALQEKIESTKKYMNDNLNWFHSNLEPSVAHSNRLEKPPANQSSRPLALVTVEHNSGGSDSTTTENEQDNVNSVVTRSSSKQMSPPLDSLASLQIHDPRPLINVGISSLDSYSSSLEDLERDIHFILHPSLPSRSMYTSPAQRLVDILPDTVPVGQQQTKVLSSDIPQLTMLNHSTSPQPRGYKSDLTC